jgi:chromosome segregation ATPase
MRRHEHSAGTMRRAACCVLVLLAPLGANLAQAQTARSGGGDSSRLLQQLAAERDRLQADNARLEQELAAMKLQQQQGSSSESALKQQARDAQASANRLAAESAGQQAKLARLQSQLDELVGKFRETAQALKDSETELGALRSSNQARERDLKACVEANSELVTMNGEILDRLENVGFWTRVAASEPFTQLKRTQLQNIADENRTRAAELKIDPSPPAATMPATQP